VLGVCNIEVKNYDINKNSSALISNVVKQAKERTLHLSEGMQQKIFIDVRGQVVSSEQKKFIGTSIAEKSNGIIKSDNIIFYGSKSK